MSILNKLMLRHLKLNKKRTIVTIIGIILSAAMIMAVTTLVASMQALIVEDLIQTTGEWHIAFKDITLKNAQYVENNENTESSFFTHLIGYAAVKDKPKPLVEIKQYSPDAIKSVPTTLKEGRMPQKDGEIALPYDMIRDKDNPIKLGDTITFDVGDLIEDTSTSEETAYMQDYIPQIQVKGKQTFTLVGIIDRVYQSYSGYYTGIAYVERAGLLPNDRITLSVQLKKPAKAYSIAPEMADAIGIPFDKEEGYEGLQYNSELLRFYGASANDSFIFTLYGIASLLILVIVTGSIMLIYNAFAISVSERSKQFGMLSSIGATPRQLQRTVVLEALFCGLIGIPLGIAAGIGGIAVTLYCVKPLFESLFIDGTQFHIVVSPVAILVSVIVGLLTILLSARIPARRAAKMSAIEAIRQTKDITLKAKSVKTSRLTVKLFGMEGALARKNLKRSKKRYRTTILSLCISIVLFLTVSTFTMYMRESFAMSYTNLNYDLVVTAGNRPDDEITEEQRKQMYNDILALDGINQHTLLCQQYMLAQLPFDELTPQIQTAAKETLKENGVPIEKTMELNFRVFSVDDAEFDRYLARIGQNPENYRDTAHPRGVLINQSTYIHDRKLTRSQQFAMRPGRVLDFYNYAYNPDAETNGETTAQKTDSISLTVGALTTELPLGVPENTSVTTGYLVVSDSVFAKMGQTVSPNGPFTSDSQLIIKTDRAKELSKEISTLVEQDYDGTVYIFNVAEELEVSRNLLLLVSVFTYGFIVLISLIGIANVFNTISTNIALRRREFAMLKSVGMTPKGFNRMIRLESLFYGLKALLYGLPIGLLISYVIYYLLTRSQGVPFLLPWGNILLCVAAIFVVVFATMRYSSAKAKKENIIDALRQETI